LIILFKKEVVHLKPTFENLSNELKRKKIRLTNQRLKVLEYVANNHCHPTVDQIYNELKKEVDTLSKTTIYNTLNTLIEANLVREVKIEDNEARYDVTVKNHGHFKCESCGNIYDFEYDLVNTHELSSFQINDQNVYLKGICPKCL
jgi:Fe2+ or Zn2+ uptake regulation protein